jgi:XTP/dITP diphosphohydrolase
MNEQKRNTDRHHPQVVLASGNTGKLAELQVMLEPAGVTMLLQRDLGISDAEETGLTFIENALIKARHASRMSGLPAIADDSGLAVDALGGAPGIYSARFAGPGASDADNNARLLSELASVPDEQRGACFHCVVVFIRHAEDPVPIVCHGRWPGHILHAPIGDNGFGYDPLFLVPEQGCSSAELPPEVKNRISHRARAMDQLLSHWL